MRSVIAGAPIRTDQGGVTFFCRIYFLQLNRGLGVVFDVEENLFNFPSVADLDQQRLTLLRGFDPGFSKYYVWQKT